MKFANGLGAWGLTFLVALGCTRSEPTVDPEMIAAHRTRLLLTEEPDGATGVLDVRETLLGPAESQEQGDDSGETENTAAKEEAGNAPQEMPVVIVGRIGGVPNPWKQARPHYPWAADQAEFVIADASAAAEVEGHGHAHDDPDHDCPFCAAAANSDVVAVVRFHDENGKVIPVDARQLFDLKGEETVVVRGQAEVLGEAKDGVLLVKADGLYVRQ